MLEDASLSSFANLTEPTRRWFSRELGLPTRVQTEGWRALATGAHTLMVAPTGSGKTLAAFLSCLDRLVHRDEQTPGTKILYVSPIKALAYDIDRNLVTPLEGLAAAHGRIGRIPRIDVRTGDTSAGERRRQLRSPAEILVTTPESLYLLLGTAARARLASVETIIIDELHAVAATKRGVHLALSLERLSALTLSARGVEPQRIGLSATLRPLAEAARFLGGDRPVTVIDASEAPLLDLQIVVPPELPPNPELDGDDRGSAWAAIVPSLLAQIQAHQQTIIFVNSRRLAERLAARITELARTSELCAADCEFVRAHHGSVARPMRMQIEAELKSGRLRAITATSSLELGIDMTSVDLVIQLESPGSVARGLQRIGRAGHQVGAVSRGRIVPKFRGDLLEAAACVRGMLVGDVEPIVLPARCLDVLAQQLVAMCSVTPCTIDELESIVRRAASYRELTRTSLISVLDMLTGRYPSDVLAELRPRLSWDRTTNIISARPGARMLAVLSGGTIPDRGLYPVHLGEGGPRVGELDEEMVHESRRGDTFLLGASTWRIEDITRDRVIVTPAPGEPGKMPFWRGDGPGRPVELGRAVGKLTRELDEQLCAKGATATAIAIAPQLHLEAHAAAQLVAYVDEQRASTGAVPSDRCVIIERFRDEVGDYRVCILTPFGTRVHAPWALLISRRLEEQLGYPVQTMVSDDGIAFRVVDGDAELDPALLLPDPLQIETLLLAELPRSARFASLFRENAARALLLPRRRPGLRTPLWAQRQRAQALLAVTQKFTDFPIVLETYRECLREVFDVPALVALCEAMATQQIEVVSITTQQASPFARALVFGYAATFLYDGDAPAAERRAQALTLDRNLLAELLGTDGLRQLLDEDILATLEAELARTAVGWQARTVDEVHDLLRETGALTEVDVGLRCVPELTARKSLDNLRHQQRATTIKLGGIETWIDSADEARYAALTNIDNDESSSSLLARFARYHGPFSATQAATKHGLSLPITQRLLASLVQQNRLDRGGFRPGGTGEEFCHVEVLRLARQRTLAALRREVESVAPVVLASFLPRWHGIGSARRGLPALRDALQRLEGAAFSFAELEGHILPARVPDFSYRMLDELGALGELAWAGRGSLGSSDGRVMIANRQHAAQLMPRMPVPDNASPIHHAVAAVLAASGAQFLVAIESAVIAALPGTARKQISEALWELMWSGVVTNDSFAPLRSRRTKPRRGATPTMTFGGRWSLVGGAQPTSPSPTAQLHAQAVALLQRWGVACRQAAQVDNLPGGFAALVPVFDTMEASGMVRRGLFSAGISGRQYATPAAIEQLRSRREPELLVIGASDPANVWGSLLPWPKLTSGSRPTRRAGAVVILVGGNPVLLVEPSTARLHTFVEVESATLARAVLKGLPNIILPERRSLQIRTIDGHPALGSSLAPLLDDGAFRRDHRGFVAQPRRGSTVDEAAIAGTP